MKKIIVTGGMGFIGSNLVRELISCNYKVLNIDSITYAATLDTLKDLESNDSLNVYKNIDKLSSENSNIENLERQLDELLLTISGKLSWGVNWIKFLAAVAPLLGLLGTVIGMIETFQAITVFGTGDPKQMAGGISQALVTTMLGLIFAAPLLGMYTLLSEKISEILQKIEEHVALVLAKKAG